MAPKCDISVLKKCASTKTQGLKRFFERFQFFFLTAVTFLIKIKKVFVLLIKLEKFN